MPETARHVPLRPLRWSAGEASAAIEEIATDALAQFHGERFWPAHPLEDRLPHDTTSFYMGATGVIWALDYLRQVGATRASFDFAPVLPRLIERNRAEFAEQRYS